MALSISDGRLEHMESLPNSFLRRELYALEPSGCWLLPRANTETDRTLCLSEKHQNRLYNERIFQLTWEQPHREIKIVKGPACLNWSMNPSPENETEAGTGSTGNAQ